jgi:hypothetical protein
VLRGEAGVRHLHLFPELTVSPEAAEFGRGAANEGDAGTIYPTQVEDSNGTQVLAGYKTGTGLPMEFTNSSPAVMSIGDLRPALPLSRVSPGKDK